ncbi:MAG: 16S rRNA (adenine(1518)-N(6)/adenine(1519)-N(6))-dimethyltransferase RsmA [Anaerolineae bacterium]
MKPLFRLSHLKDFLTELGNIKANRRLSQNFLIDGNIIRKIIQTGAVLPGDLVVEIGSGPGALTQALLEAGAQVIAIEKDPLFARELFRLQTNDKRLEVMEADFLKLPIEELLREKCHLKKKAKVVANLPYHITTPIIAKLIPLHQLISSLTLMVQKEVAVRFTAEAGSRDYSSITVFLNYFSHPRFCFTIAPSCFYPSPSVQSAIVQFELRPPLLEPHSDLFFKLTRTAFQKRRKMLRASLKSTYGSAAVEHALITIEKNPKSRPEDLTLQDFLSLFHCLHPS